MAIGQKMGSLKTLKQSLQKGGGGSAWIKYVPKNGSMNVRFIQEPEEWMNYVEHFDTTLRKSYPCNGENTCPGCTTGERKSNRYLTNAVDVDSDRVIPLQLPKDLANRLVVRYERNGTLTDRDFELSRSGEGLDTVYDLDAQAVDRKNITKYQPLDLMKVLTDAYNDVFGGPEVEETAPVTTSRAAGIRGRSKTQAAAQVDDEVQDTPEPEEDTQDDVEDPPPIKTKPAAKKAAKKATVKADRVGDIGLPLVSDPTFVPDDGTADVDDGTDDTPEVDDPDDDDTAYDEATLQALPLGALRAVAREFGVETRGKQAPAIIAEILENGDPVDTNPPY